jgi:hypothetical protein
MFVFKDECPKAYKLHLLLTDTYQIINLKPSENMKELKDQNQIHISTVEQATKKHFSRANYWKLAKRKQVSGIIQRTNYMVEHYFKQVIAEAKRLHAPLKPIVFERDYRECTGEYGCSMHTFASSTFYFHLECSATMEYWFRYDFNDCQFEAEIVALIERLFAFHGQNKRDGLLPETFEYFSGELIDEENEFLYTLQAD